MTKLYVHFLLLFIFLYTNITYSQEVDTLVQKPVELKDKKLDSLMLMLNSESLKENTSNYERNVLMTEQNRNFNILNELIQKANSTLKEGIDYKEFTTELDLLLKWKEETVIGILTDKNKMQTVRDLTTTSILTKELLKRTNTQLEKISLNNTVLSTILRQIDSTAINKVFYIIPKNEVAKKNYYQRMAKTTVELSEANTNLKNAIDSIQKLEVKGNSFKYRLEADLAIINKARKTLSEKISGFSSDIPETNENHLTFGENLKHSFVKGYLLLVFYIANQTGILTIMLIFVIALIIYLRVIRRKYKKAGIYDDLRYPGHVLNYPVASSLLIIISIFQFFIPTPPFVFTAVLWTICGIALTIILYKSVTKYWFIVWLSFIILNNIAFQDNLLLLYSPGESRFVLLMSIVGLILGLYLLKSRKIEGKTIKEKSFVVALIVFTILELFAAVGILNESYNLGKALMTNGYFTILIAYQLIWAFGLSLDILNISKYLNQSEEEEYIAKNGEAKEFKVPNFIYVLFALGCYVLLFRNTYMFQNFIDPITAAFYEEQKVGEFTFSFNGIFVFFFVLFMSGLSAKIVSFLTNVRKTNDSGATKSGLGSWLLLIRISIITFGVLIAFVSVGIPMDKIALMISALSVGIGFGLQNVINNLVSGVIIAFEKPINLDDIVEVGSNTGKMKSIGIRSSVITTWDGADVIIPNGDLLSQHLVNWTMGSTRRRFEINLGVAYGSDLNQVKNILSELLQQHNLVLKNPAPLIWITQFNDSSIDFVIKYWVSHFNFGNDVRTDLIIAIDTAFKTNGIEIPFPQQDIHVQSIKTDSNIISKDDNDRSSKN